VHRRRRVRRSWKRNNSVRRFPRDRFVRGLEFSRGKSRDADGSEKDDTAGIRDRRSERTRGRDFCRRRVTKNKNQKQNAPYALRGPYARVIHFVWFFVGRARTRLNHSDTN